MNQQAPTLISKKWLHILCSAVLLISFFLPWVNWDGSKVAGYAMATGDFFKVSDTRFGLANPFPGLSFSFYAFWLIAALSIAIIFLTISNKKTGWLPFITGAISLSLVTVYVLFTGQLLDLGIGKSVSGMMTAFAWLHAFAAIGLVLSVPAKASLLKKVAWIIAGPVFVFASFKLAEKYVMGETHQQTVNIKEDYTLKADDLIKEFMSNDTAANKKYVEKVLIVNGNASAVDVLADSTSTISFADSTGSYAIFSLEKSELDNVKKIKTGDAVSLKGVCSGSIFSEILGTTSISFKRATLNKK